MKSILATISILASTISAIAVPAEEGLYVRNSADISAENMMIVDLVVEDDRFPGLTFSGDAKSIFEEMAALKPEVFAEETSDVSTRSLAKRESLNCNWSSNILGWNSCNENYDYLKRIGGSRCYVNASPACARVACSHGCGVMLCNQTNKQLWVLCGDIANDQKYIMNNCPHGALEVASGARGFGTHYIGVGVDSCK